MKKNIASVVVYVLANVIFNNALADESGGLKTLRGDTPITALSPAPANQPWQSERDPIMRNYLNQPPLIPHEIENYQIDLRFNKCMSCHAWDKAKDSKATKISVTHFVDRDGNELAEVSPRRYFCVQCHVPQKDIVPLVKNVFEPIKALTRD